MPSLSVAGTVGAAVAAGVSLLFGRRATSAQESEAQEEPVVENTEPEVSFTFAAECPAAVPCDCPSLSEQLFGIFEANAGVICPSITAVIGLLICCCFARSRGPEEYGTESSRVVRELAAAEFPTRPACRRWGQRALADEGAY